MATRPDSLSPVPRLEAGDDVLRIQWAGQPANAYHYFWLRSACFCELCGDSHTGSRRLHPSDVSPNIRPRDISMPASDRLRIVWEPDGLVSEFSCGWLRDYVYDGERERWRPQLWDATLELADVSHRLDEIENSDRAALDFMRCLRDYGLAVVRRGACRAVGIEAMAALIGDIAEAAYKPVFELRPDPAAHTFGNTMQPVPPHTDEAYLHTPTGILVLYCIKPARDGGETALVDGFQVATRLRESDPEAFDLLARCPQTYHRIVPGAGMDFRTRARALNVDERGDLVGFRFHPRAMAPTDVDPEIAAALHRANAALSSLILDPAQQLEFGLRAGDAVLFDNHRIMHARRAFADPARHLQICNVSRDHFHQKLRLAAARLGYDAEARQILPAGVSG